MNIQAINNLNSTKGNAISEKENRINFKGNVPVKSFGEKFGDKVGEVYAKYYAKPMYNQMLLQKFSEQVAKIPGSYTEHMSALGSAITSSVYMKRTLDNKDLDDDKKKTLAVNQGLCFVIPTILSYWINGKLVGFNKKQEYDYAFRQDKKIANGKIHAKELEAFNKATSERLKGFKTFSSLLTFTLIYRYASPVLITPAANKLTPYIERFFRGSKKDNTKEASQTKPDDSKTLKKVA